MATIKKAAALTTANKKIQLAAIYQNLPPEANEKATNRIANRRVDTQKSYRRNYEKAVSGRSLRAAVNASWLECVMWQRVEVRLCPSYPCPLWPYRPYQDVSKKPFEGPDYSPESTKSAKGGNDAG